MSSPKLIAIIGVTGQQGLSVAHSLLHNPSTFKVRGLTRSPDSAPAKELKALGAEIIKADLFNKDDLAAAFVGAWGTYINTNSADPAFKSPGSPGELEVGKAIVNAAAAAGVKHVVISSAPPHNEILTRIGAPEDTHGSEIMEAKYNIEQHAIATRKFETVIPVSVGWYLSNFLWKELAPALGGFPFQPDAEGYLTYSVPHWGSADGKTGDNRVPFLSIEDDLGDIIQGLFLDPKSWNQKIIPAGGDLVSWGGVVDTFAKVTGKKARFAPVLPDWRAFDTAGVHALEEVKYEMAFTQATGGLYFGPEKSEIETAAGLKRKVAQLLGKPQEKQSLTTAKEWFVKNADKF